MPFFSIVIPTYNRAHMIGRTVKTVLDQEFQDWELIIVDDGSTDNTKEVLRQFTDTRIRCFSRPNMERGASRNFGASQAIGRFLNFFDSDDLMKPFHLRLAHDELTAKPNAKVMCFSWDFCDINGNLTGKGRTLRGDLNVEILKRSCIHLNGGFIDRDLFLQTKFSENREFNICEDWYLYLRLSLQTKLVGNQTPTFNYVLHPDSTMNNMKPEAFITAFGYFELLIANEKKIHRYRRFILSELHSMLGLSLALTGYRKASFLALLKSLLIRPVTVFSRRTLGILKNLVYAKRRG